MNEFHRLHNKVIKIEITAKAGSYQCVSLDTGFWLEYDFLGSLVYQRLNEASEMNVGVKKLTAIDLYCGSGAVTEGLKDGKFKVVAAVDNDPISCKTYRKNHPEVYLIESDIRSVSPKALQSQLKIDGRIDLLVVCAPCQPFSRHNQKRTPKDPRADLVMEAIKFVRFFKPRVIFIENVPGIVINGPTSLLKDELSKFGYCLGTPRMIDAADCSVPQRRERCIMVAAPNASAVENFYESIEYAPRVTVWDTISTLKPLAAGEKDIADPLHFARRHKPIVLERLHHIPQNGGSRCSLPRRLELRCHIGRKNDFPDVYGRMCWDDVAPTLTTGCTDVTKGRFAHPRDDRAITLREAALLQSFPTIMSFAAIRGKSPARSAMPSR